MSANFQKGWTALESSKPSKITDFIAFAQLGATTGIIKDSSEFYIPATGGSWVTTPITINAEPSINSLNAATFKDEEMIANAINAQTKMVNLTAPSPLNNIIYLYTNKNGDLKYEMDIDLDFGGSNFNSVQISEIYNACGKGDEHGNVQVFSFEPGPFTGVQTLKLVLSGFIGQFHVGIRAVATPSLDTSLFDLTALMYPIEHIEESLLNKEIVQINGYSAIAGSTVSICTAVCDGTIVAICGCTGMIREPKPKPKED